MPTVRGKTRTITITPEGLASQIEHLQKIILQKQRHLGVMGGIENLDAEITKRQKQVEALNAQIKDLSRDVRKTILETEHTIAAQRAAFSRDLKREREQIEDLRKRTTEALAARREEIDEASEALDRQKAEAHEARARAAEDAEKIAVMRKEIERDRAFVAVDREAITKWATELSHRNDNLNQIEERVKERTALNTQKEELLASVDAELGRRKAEIEKMIQNLGEKMNVLKRENQELQAAQDAFGRERQEVLEKHALANKTLEEAKVREASAKATLLKTEESERRMVEREARLLQVEARNKEDEKRIQAVRAEIMARYREG